MAYFLKKVDPVDIGGKKIIGVKFPFNNPSVFTPTYQTKDAIRSNLILYFSTSPGERYMNPAFGLDLRRQLFEHLTEQRREYIKDLVQAGLNTYFPLVAVESLTVEEIADYTVQIHLEYSLRNRGIQDEITVNLTNDEI